MENFLDEEIDILSGLHEDELKRGEDEDIDDVDAVTYDNYDEDF